MVEHAPGETAIIVLSAVGTLFAYVLALVVLRADRHRAMNRRLALVLFADGTFLAMLWGTSVLYDGALDVLRSTGEWLAVMAALGLVALSYLAFVAQLDTPLSSWLRRTAIRRSLYAAIVALLVGDAARAILLMRADAALVPEDVAVELAWPLVAVLSLFALIVTVHAYVRAPRGTPGRRRAGFFALAFGMRDVLLAGGISAGASSRSSPGRTSSSAPRSPSRSPRSSSRRSSRTASCSRSSSTSTSRSSWASAGGPSPPSASSRSWAR